MEKSEKEPLINLNIFRRLRKCREEIQFVTREEKKVNGQYYPLSYNAVVSQCKPILEKYGIGLIFHVKGCQVRDRVSPMEKAPGEKYVAGYFTDCYMVVCAVNNDNPTDRFEFGVSSTCFDTLDKATAKALTAARKQAYIALLQLEVYDDADEEGQEESRKRREAISSVTPAQITRISEEQVGILSKLAAEAKVGPEIVAKAADPSLNSISEIPVAKYEEVFTRLNNRVSQLRAAAEAPN